MNDLGSLTGAPGAIEIRGQRYECHPLRLADLGELQRWLHDQLPDPMRVARKAIDADPDMPLTQQQFLLRCAIEEASKPRLHISDPGALQYLNSADGLVFLFWLAVRRGQPGMTLEKASQLLTELTPDEYSKARRISEVDEVLAETTDPKVRDGSTT